MTSAELLIEKNKILKQALATLKVALNEEENEFTRDASIQRFEFCYELGWKLLKKVVEYEDRDLSGGPASTIKKAVEMRILDREDLWLDMHRSRNLTTLTYDQKVADDIYRALHSHHNTLKKFAELVDNRY
jgi:nucleotidyltransferase substrate binding protein (TIGR01987 family)